MEAEGQRDAARSRAVVAACSRSEFPTARPTAAAELGTHGNRAAVFIPVVGRRGTRARPSSFPVPQGRRNSRVWRSFTSRREAPP
uniref:Uncharacterized protein n=1 Tax=Arundo donax TaxID=35708 RepID=A0A0A8YH40_ARUDO